MDDFRVLKYPETDEDVAYIKRIIDEYENAKTQEEKEQAKVALKLFNKHFPKTPDGFKNKIHGYIYLKYMYLYIYKMASALGRYGMGPDTAVHPAEEFSEEVEQLVNMCVSAANMGSMDVSTNTYHAKVMVHDDAKKLFHLEEDLNLESLPKTVIPYELARDAIIKSHDALAVIECSCRHTRGDAGCWPRDVCITLGEPWVSMQCNFLVGGMKPRRITQEEALAILDAEHKRGHVHNLFFKDACNNQIYGICNCCGCCCVALQAFNYAGCPMFAPSGYISEVDLDKCQGCGDCASSCIFKVLDVKDGKRVVVENKRCMGCGVCVDKCSHGALTLKRDDPSVSEPFDLDKLIPEYSVKNS